MREILPSRHYANVALLQVALIYKDPSIGNSMTVSLARIMTLEDGVLQEEEVKEDGDSGGKSASAMLHRWGLSSNRHVIHIDLTRAPLERPESPPPVFRQ